MPSRAGLGARPSSRPRRPSRGGGDRRRHRERLDRFADRVGELLQHPGSAHGAARRPGGADDDQRGQRVVQALGGTRISTTTTASASWPSCTTAAWPRAAQSCASTIGWSWITSRRSGSATPLIHFHNGRSISGFRRRRGMTTEEWLRMGSALLLPAWRTSRAVRSGLAKGRLRRQLLASAHRAVARVLRRGRATSPAMPSVPATARGTCVSSADTRWRQRGRLACLQSTRESPWPTTTSSRTAAPSSAR